MWVEIDFDKIKIMLADFILGVKLILNLEL